MSIGVLVINFGEPDEPTPEKVEAFLHRIFLQNAPLEAHEGDAAWERARQLARARAPALADEYRSISGSPLNRQATVRAGGLERVLRSRGSDARTYPAFQFTEPFIAEALRRARDDGVDVLVALPVYPLCGQSTTVAALHGVRRALDDMDWHPEWVSLSGWHHDPRYLAARAGHIQRFVTLNGLDLEDPDTILYFSAHGTPLKYLEAGSRYDRYVAEHCQAIATALGGVPWAVGFQNHANRGIPWTRPGNEDRIRELSAHRLVIDAVSFLHEQSETLAELDHELRDFVESLGKEIHRVPVPHDDEALLVLLADLVGRAVAAARGADSDLTQCRCVGALTAWCTNGARDLPPSLFAGAPAVS